MICSLSLWYGYVACASTVAMIWCQFSTAPMIFSQYFHSLITNSQLPRLWCAVNGNDSFVTLLWYVKLSINSSTSTQIWCQCFNCHYIMIVATANIITTTKDMLPMLQDMLPLPQLCPECQMLARVPASASETSATSVTSDHPRSPPTSGQPRPWRQPSSNGRRGRQLASPTSQSQASSDQSRMARIIWALLQFALIFRSPALLILFSLLSDIFKAIP